MHDKNAGDAPFTQGLLLVERAATDDRHFVKKAVNMALRSIGKRNPALNTAAVAVARRLAASPEAAARWGEGRAQGAHQPHGYPTARDTTSYARDGPVRPRGMSLLLVVAQAAWAAQERRDEIVSRRSAIQWPERLTLPLLLMHGSEDSDVSPAQTLRLATLIAKAQKQFGASLNALVRWR